MDIGPWEATGKPPVLREAKSFTTLSLRHSQSFAVATFATPRARPGAPRAFGAASGAPWESLGNLTVRYRGCSPQEPRLTHDEVKQQRRGLGAFFEATPGRVLGDFVLKYGP